MEIRFMEALISLMSAAAVAIGLWNRLKIAKLNENVDGKMDQIVRLTQAVAYNAGKQAGVAEGEAGPSSRGVLP